MFFCTVSFTVCDFLFDGKRKYIFGREKLNFEKLSEKAKKIKKTMKIKPVRMNVI